MDYFYDNFMVLQSFRSLRASVFHAVKKKAKSDQHNYT